MSLLCAERERAAQVQRRLGFAAPFTWRERFADRFARWRWVRRSAGGKWELWALHLPMAGIWFWVSEWSYFTDWRPPCGAGCIDREEW